MTQSSGGSQLTPEQKFYQNAEVMPLRKMVQLSEDSNSQISSLKGQEPLLEDITAAESNETDVIGVCPTISLSGTDEIDPDNLEMKTPPKRKDKEMTSSSQQPDVEELIGEKMSSTKQMKIPKKE
ncbi:hypothetical protein TSUD_381990 [Trifolium subterraneum]|uniref:Uncharacterized protein n=1 Tax=Trifolium subterraneum TaxID=3900 RepID=A0A2Z6MP50_TRISU|nr:hypothetical protein TSUD_381990 [Trifolium subterraneum]